MAAPRQEPMSVRITLYSPFLQSKRLQYGIFHVWPDPGGLLVVLVICRCVNAMEATMDTARSVEEDGYEVNASVGCKVEGKSTAVTS